MVGVCRVVCVARRVRAGTDHAFEVVVEANIQPAFQAISSRLAIMLFWRCWMTRTNSEASTIESNVPVSSQANPRLSCSTTSSLRSR